jgi:nucleoside-diphosphate-sugar epimerase
MILDIIGSKARLEFDKSKPTALRERRVDISKARKVLSYRPLVSLRDGLADTIEWYKGATLNA